MYALHVCVCVCAWVDVYKIHTCLEFPVSNKTSSLVSEFEECLVESSTFFPFSHCCRLQISIAAYHRRDLGDNFLGVATLNTLKLFSFFFCCLSSLFC